MANRNLVALRTIWIKECTRFLRIWVQTIGATCHHHDPLFCDIRQFDRQPHRSDGRLFSYMEFIVPGLDNDGRDHQLLFQRVIVILLQCQISAQC